MEKEEILKKREKEKDTVELMIKIYCHKKHGTKGDNLCPECEEVAKYAFARVNHCPHMETKTFCSNCKTHCYSPVMREKIRQVMRFSGPRMIFYCPGLMLKHMFLNHKKQEA